METVTLSFPLNSPLLAAVLAALGDNLPADFTQPAPAANQPTPAADTPKRGRGRPRKEAAPEAPAEPAAAIDIKATVSNALKTLGPAAVRDVFKKFGISKMADASPADQIKIAEELDEMLMIG